MWRLAISSSSKEDWGQCYKTFYGRNLRMLWKSQSFFCPWQAFPISLNINSVCKMKGFLSINEPVGSFCLLLSMQKSQYLCQLSLRPLIKFHGKVWKIFELNILVSAKFCTISSRSWFKSFALHEYRSYLLSSIVWHLQARSGAWKVLRACSSALVHWH